MPFFLPWWQLTKNYVSESLNIFNEETEEVTTDITEGSKELMGDIKDKSGQLWDKSKELPSFHEDSLD